VEPRLALFQQLNRNFSLNLSGEQKNQGVLQFTDVENPFLGVENKRWILANNEDLPILKSQQIALGASFKKDGWTLGVTSYYKRVEHISTFTQGFRNQFIDVISLGSYDATGVELSANKKSKPLNVWLSYSFVQSDYNFPELNPSSFRNNFATRHSVNLAATYALKSFLFSAGSTYKYGNSFTDVATGNEIVMTDGAPEINFKTPNEGILDAYFRTDFSAAYSFKLDETFRGKLNLAILNIFNRRNALDTYFRLQANDDGEFSVNKIEQFSLGFTPNISFQLLF
jgi:outer membrane receptor for ferrienterochelin and colicin